MHIAVLGLGYIGLPTAAMLACAGHCVAGVDLDEDLLGDITAGCGHIAELEVRALTRSALDSGNLRVGSSLPERADAFLICVPTPSYGHVPDLRYVERAAEQVAERADEGDLVVLESTVPPGTVENVIVRALLAAGKEPDAIHIAHCPERVIPGAIVRELRENSRVVGGRKAADAQAARKLYATFCNGEICTTDCRTAELVKVVENTFRDVNIAFANELALLSEALGVDVWEVIELANRHPRVSILRPGPGVGGHCIPVDPTFLADANPFVTELIQAARRVNERMPRAVARMIDELLAPEADGAKIALLGAAYKGDVDDARESPAAEVVRRLHERRYEVAVYDPLVRTFSYPLAESLEEAVTGADAIVLISPHSVFRQIEPAPVARFMRRPALVDTCRFLDPVRWTDAGFSVRTLGSPPMQKPPAAMQNV